MSLKLVYSHIFSISYKQLTIIISKAKQFMKSHKLNITRQYKPNISSLDIISYKHCLNTKQPWVVVHLP